MDERKLLRRRLLQGAGAFALLGARLPRALAADATGPYDWKTVPFGAGGFIDGFVYHPKTAGVLYARTDIGGLYRFDPAARSWVPLIDQMGHADGDLMGVLSIAVDPHDADRVYAACGIYTGDWARKAAVLASSDRGATWKVNDLGVRLGGNEPGRGTGERLQVDPNRGDILFLGTTRDGLLRSTDRGATFASVAFPASHVSLVVIDPRSASAGQPSQAIYAGSHDKPGLYVSHDGGHSFAREPGTPGQVPQRACFGADGTLYVTFALGEAAFATNPGNASDGGVWKRDAAGHWKDISPVKPGPGDKGFGYSGLDIDRQRPGRLVVSTIERWTDGDDLFVSSDDGAHWTPLHAHSRHDATPWPWLANYMKGEDRMGHWLADVKIDPFDSECALYGTGYGLWMTHNLGAAEKGATVRWDFTVANFEETATLQIRSPSGGATLLAAMGDVSGAAWDNVARTPGAGLFAPEYQTNRSVDFAQLKPAILARTVDQADTGGFWSPDGGVSWRPFGPSPRRTASAQGARLDAGHIAVSANGSAFLWVPEKQPALFSRDHGKTWIESAGWPATRDVKLVPVADRVIDGVFYVHDRANGQILASVDGGMSFKPCITGLPPIDAALSSQMICTPAGMRDLWLALPSGLFHFAGPEQPVRTLKQVVEPWLVAIGKGAPDSGLDSLYVWGKVRIGATLAEGLFRSDDGGASFLRINDDRHRYGYLLSIAADPLEYGTLYVAAHGRGVLVGRPRAA